MLFRRPLFPCLLAYVSGLCLARIGAGLPWSCLVGAAAGLLLLAGGLYRKTRNFVFILLLGILAVGSLVMTGILVENRQALALADNLADSKLREVTGRIEAIRSFSESESERCELTDVTISSGTALIDFPAKILLGISLDNREGKYAKFAQRLDLTAGDVIRVLAEVRPNEGFQNFFGYNKAQSLAEQNILASSTISNPALITKLEKNRDFIARFAKSMTEVRRWCRLAIERNMSHHEARLMVAMLFNDTQLLGNSDQKVFRDSATFHLFSVSGMHIGVMALALILLFRFCRFSFRGAWTLAVVLLFGYLWLIDFVVPATRAWLMVATYAAGLWLNREVDGFSSLLFSVCVLVVLDPMSPWQPGFQLSVLGVLAIVLLVPFIKNWKVRRGAWKKFDFLRRWIADPVLESVIVTVSVTMMLFPLELFYFFQFNWLSPIANLVQAFLSIFVIAAGMLVIGTAAIWAPAAKVFGQAATLLMNWLFHVSDVAAGADWAIWRTGTIPFWIVFLYIGILLSGYYLTFQDTPEFRLKSRARFVTHSTCCLACVYFWWLLSSMPGHRLSFYFFDVGQGDSSLAIFPNGQTMLVDAGKELPDMGKLVVEPQLKALGLKKIDYLVATHPDEDHIGGIPWIMENFKIGSLIEPWNLGIDNPIMARIHRLALSHGVPVIKAIENSDIEGSSVQVRILNPPAGVIAGDLADNNKSVVLSVSMGSFSCLLMADAEIPVENRLLGEHEVHKITVLKVGHHGSHTSSQEAFLKQTAPQISVISCGRHNRFGHPNPEVLHRLTQNSQEIFRTDEDGAVRITTDGNTWKAISAASGN